MPYAGEGASPTAHVDIIRNPEVVEFLRGCTYNPDPSNRVQEICSRLVNVTDRVQSIDRGVILATDGSPYEAIIEKRFPSVRVGFLKLSNVLILVPDYRRLQGSSSPFVDPREVARIQRGTQSLSLVLPGSGVLREGVSDSRSFFRQALFHAFLSPEFTVSGIRLYDTLIELLRRTGSVVTREGFDGILFGKGRKCPADDIELKSDLFVPLDPGYVASPTGGREPVYVTDALRVHEPFVDDGSNVECFNRLMTALEHILTIHLISCAARIDPSVTDNMHVIVDGPLAIFGEPARFHRGIMSVLHDIRVSAQSRGQPGPLVIGLSKTGKIVEHAVLIERYLRFMDDGVTPRAGTWILPVDDDYRQSFVQPSGLPSGRNFGDDTYYGQNFIVRTSTGKTFDACVAYPFPNKNKVEGRDFRELKVDIEAYGDLIGRAVSLIEMMQMDLYDNSMIAVHLAHKYASIAHSPSGRSLDQFVREIIKPRR